MKGRSGGLFYMGRRSNGRATRPALIVHSKINEVESGRRPKPLRCAVVGGRVRGAAARSSNGSILYFILSKK
jgi:hypothetical protein